MRDEPFKTNSELDEYFDQNRLQCLFCGKRFKNLTLHLNKYHHMSGDDYRDQWGIPRGRGLVGRELHDKLSEEASSRWDSGLLNADHLPKAAELIDYDERTGKVVASIKHQIDAVKTAKPWLRKQLPAGAKRSDGRDADKAREYQRAYRAQKSGDDRLVNAYRKKYKPDST